jgi:alkylation response protein AidB-like acyl-CoA dehydrogenase
MQLNHERVALLAPGPVTRFVEEVIAWAKETRLADGRRVIDQPWVQTHLARARAHVEVLRLLAWRHAWKIDQGTLDPAEASTVKVFGSESFVQIYSLLLEVLGPLGIVKAGSPGAILRGRIEMYYRTTLVLTFGGGVNEVQRDIIAMAGLGLPRALR